MRNEKDVCRGAAAFHDKRVGCEVGFDQTSWSRSWLLLLVQRRAATRYDNNNRLITKLTVWLVRDSSQSRAFPSVQAAVTRGGHCWYWTKAEQRDGNNLRDVQITHNIFLHSINDNKRNVIANLGDAGRVVVVRHQVCSTSYGKRILKNNTVTSSTESGMYTSSTEMLPPECVSLRRLKK